MGVVGKKQIAGRIAGILPAEIPNRQRALPACRQIAGNLPADCRLPASAGSCRQGAGSCRRGAGNCRHLPAIALNSPSGVPSRILNTYQ